MIDRRLLLFVCLLSPMFAISSASAQQGAASPARAVNSVKAKNPAAPKDSVSAKSADSLAAKGGAAVHDSSSAETAHKGLDLDKLLADDDEGDLLAEEKPAVHKASAGDSASAGHAPAKDDGRPADEREGAKSADGAERVSAPGRRGPPPSKAAESDAVETGPAIVEEGRTINFAQNLKEYKSPRKAMLLSLLLPGLGQAYSRSYVKASAFGAAEIAAIVAAVCFNAAAKSTKDKAYRFADERFDTLIIRKYDDGLREKFQNNESEIEKDSLFVFTPYDKDFYEAAYRNVYFYESIRGKKFAPGWEDNELTVEQLLNDGKRDTVIYGKGESRYEFYGYEADGFYYFKRIFDVAGKAVTGGGPTLGYSSSQDKYNSMINESNSYRDAVNYMFYVMILNHIVSAIDAGFTARAYNARLLGEDNSAWNRLSVEQLFVFTGSEISPGVALRLRF